ncbi:hypothetical protein DB30_02748 [Enhygromyxa salina]|uniref:Uncharacterized protein n=1 Tax=Enhygromyxa salina TaxID=215803 RepID=A0A0C2DIH1_9BACT|nr:hypothetical protein [Enhygromyxa salina]KIG19467.1 hypothetical protein DB30_02748 [Enhygromyxa salina]
MDPILIGGIAVFVVMAVVLGVAWGGSTLSKLALASDERVLFELEGITVSQHSAGGVTNFIRCVVRVTDRRIIVAQKALLAKDPALRFVITHAGVAGDAELGTTLKTGYISCTVAPSEIQTKLNKAGQHIWIPLRGGAIVGEQSLRFLVPDLEPWRAAGILA